MVRDMIIWRVSIGVFLIAALLVVWIPCFSFAEDAADIEKLKEQLNKLYSQGRYSEAAEIGEHLLRMVEKAKGPDHPETAISLNKLALSYLGNKDYARAEPLFQRALKIREKVLGADHPSTASSLNNLAMLYQDMGDYARAEPLYKRALEIREKVFGPEHTVVATCLNNLGVVQEKAKEYDKAIENLEKYLALAPNATDADVVRDFIYKIEFLKERGWSMEDLVGTWVGPKEVGNLTISLKKSGERYPKRFFYQKGEFVVMPSWPSDLVHIHYAKFDGKQLIISLSHFHGNEMTGYSPIRDEYYDLTMVFKGWMTGTVKINEEKGRKTITGEWLRR